MNTYIIQHRLHTLAKYYKRGPNYDPIFSINDMEFAHWEFNLAEGHKTDFWIVGGTIHANDYKSAISEFYKKFIPIASQIAFLSQCYTEYQREPFLIQKQDSNIALFKYMRDRQSAPLAFDEKSLQALSTLDRNAEINDEFYYYWNDMINVTGYSAKLLLLCSALEALARSSINPHTGKNKKFDFLRDILGKELKNKFWEKDTGVRHRLNHGEYFNQNDGHENYVQQAYEKIISYFNRDIFQDTLINQDVVNPQRHPHGKKEGGYYWIKNTTEISSFDLKYLVENWNDDLINDPDPLKILSKEPVSY